MPRVIVDNEVHKKITTAFPTRSFNHSLRRYCGLPDNGRVLKKEALYASVGKHIFKWFGKHWRIIK